MKNIFNSSVGASLRTAQNNSADAQPRHKPQRLPDFDYSAEGAYFVTICVKDRLPVLGKFVGEEVVLSPSGETVKYTWNSLPVHYDAVELDEFIVMPNHVHGIIWILSKSSIERSVGEGLRPSPTVPHKLHGLPEIIRAFKSFSAREITSTLKTSGAFWQRGYHEHILRNDEDLFQHRAYIISNPLKWPVDEYYQ